MPLKRRGSGNRSAHTEAGDDSGANPRAYGYTANALNQYTDIDYEPGNPTAPRAFDIFGTAADPAVVDITIDGGMATHPEHQQPPYFHGEAEVSGSAASYHEVVVDEGQTSVDGHQFAPARERGLTYDLDGNLLSDGHWLSEWDAESRRRAGAKMDGHGPPAGRDELGARASQNRLVSVLTAPGLDAVASTLPRRHLFCCLTILSDL